MLDRTGQILKGYEFGTLIGAGGMGDVYLAFQPTVGREVVIKIIKLGFANKPDFIRRFETEAHLIARLEHLHIVPLYDYWRDPTGAYLVMRYLRGGNLQDALQQGPYDLEATALLLDQVASALAVAHRNNVIHRDIKPANILLDEDGNAYLTDFGIAKDLTITDDGVTAPDMMIGSPDYLSPEQARSEPISPQTDIYSLGIVLYEMLAGEHPFMDVSTVERLFRHISEPVPRISSLAPDVIDAINAVIQKATAKNPVSRYDNVSELAAAFRKAANLSVSRVEPSLVELLTPREQEVLQLMVDGKNNREIASLLTIELTTAKWYVRQIYQKMNVRSRVQAIVRARELDLIVDGDLRPVSATTIEIASLPEPENPYKGLRPFQSVDEQDFFGREKLIKCMLKQLEEKDKLARFLAVVGPSGSGKSSLVKAGLIPALWRGQLPDSDKWYIVQMMPGDRPLDELEVALMRIAAEQDLNLGEQLQRDAKGLLRAAGLILPDDESQLLLVVDQFEELFTLVDDEQTRIHFLNLLYTAVTATRSRVRVIITLRADFYDRPLQYPDFGDLVRSRMETIMPLSAEELERAIRCPSERVDVMFEEGLIPSIISDVLYQSGGLPLLQYALTELFEHREDRLLTGHAYEQIGRAVGALANRAEEIYAELGETYAETTRQMFLRLVTLGEGVEDTRRRVHRSELLSVADDADTMDEVIDTYTSYRLLSLDRDPITRSPTVEIAHEALLYEWKRLRLWLDESRDDVRLQRLLNRMASEWHESDQDSSYLMRGSRLEQYELWVKDTQLALTSRERAFLDASVKQRDEEAAVAAERQAREARLEQRARRVLQVLVGVFLVAALVSGGLALWALGQRQEARRQASIGLASQAMQELESKFPDRSVPLALEAMETYPYTWQAERALGQAVIDNRLLHTFVGHDSALFSIDLSPDNHYIVTASYDNTAIIWDVKTGKEIASLEGHQGLVTQAYWSPSGKYIVTASYDTTARIWDAATGEVLFILSEHQGPVIDIEWSPDGEQIATVSFDGTAKIWDASTGNELLTLSEHSGIVYGVAWSHQGQYIATASLDTTARIWDARTGETLFTLSHDSPVATVIWSPDDQQVVTGTFAGPVYVWDVASGEQQLVLPGHTGEIWKAVYSPDGSYIGTASTDGSVRMWDVADGKELFRFNNDHHTINVPRLAWSPDGSRLVASSFDGSAVIWDTATGKTHLKLAGHTGFIREFAWSVDGRLLFTAGEDGTVRMWNVADSYQVLTGHTDRVTGLAWSPDDTFIASASYDQTIKIWDAATGQELRTLEGHDGPAWDLRWSPDGKRLLSGSPDRTARIWDAATGLEILTLTGHKDTIMRSTWSPDGTQIVTASFDGTAIIWDSETGEVLLIINGGEGVLLTGSAWSPDGSQVALTTSDSSVMVMDAVTGEQLMTLKGDGSMSVAFWSPDGSRIATHSDDGIGRIWDASTGEVLVTFTGHTGSVWGLVWDADGERILTASHDGSAKLWNASTGAELATYYQGAPLNRATWSSDEQRIAISSWDGKIRIFDVQWQTQDELIAYARDCCLVRDLTTDERELFGLPVANERTSEDKTAGYPVRPYTAAFATFSLMSLGLVVVRRQLKH